LYYSCVDLHVYLQLYYPGYSCTANKNSKLVSFIIIFTPHVLIQPIRQYGLFVLLVFLARRSSQILSCCTNGTAVKILFRFPPSYKFKNSHTHRFCVVTPINSSKYRYLSQFCYVKIICISYNKNLFCSKTLVVLEVR
jgi:hypothetical protein